MKRHWQKKTYLNPYFPAKRKKPLLSGIFLLFLLFLLLLGLAVLSWVKIFPLKNIEEERISSLIWVTGEKRYYLDLNGQIVRTVQLEESINQAVSDDLVIVRSQLAAQQYPIIYDLSNQPAVTNQFVIEPQIIQFILDLTENIKAKADFDLSHYNLADAGAQDITLVTKEGWQVHFSFKQNLQVQVKKLLLLLSEEISDRSNLQYIDLRFGDKVFYQ
jgi:hypothetical protein